MIVKHRWYRDSSKWENQTLRKLLQGVGDSGMNLFPVPMQFNRYLDKHRYISLVFNTGVYGLGGGSIFAGAYTINYVLHNAIYNLSASFWENVWYVEEFE